MNEKLGGGFALIHMTEEYQETLQEFGWSGVLGLILFGAILLFMTLGLLTEKSFLFGRQYY